MIRLATAEDHSSILELAISFHKESIYSKYEFNEEKVEEFLHSSLATPHDFLFLVAEHKHKVVGLFFAIKTTLPLYKTTTTFEIAWYVLPKYRKGKLAIQLFKTYEYWSKEIAKADICQAGTSIELDLTNLYTRMGYTPVEKSFVKDNK